MNLESTSPRIKTGNEQLVCQGQSISFSLLDFWKWSVSDILSNATRGRFAEFIVATAVNVNISAVRDEWNPFDLETSGGIKLEVKSAAYLQSWFQNTLSKISFSIKPSRFWNSLTNTSSTISKRHADVYIFCLLKHERKDSVDPLNLDQWEFYVVSTKQLDSYTRSKHSITLKSLKKLSDPVDYFLLEEKIINAHRRVNI